MAKEEEAQIAAAVEQAQEAAAAASKQRTLLSCMWWNKLHQHLRRHSLKFCITSETISQEYYLTTSKHKYNNIY